MFATTFTGSIVLPGETTPITGTVSENQMTLAFNPRGGDPRRGGTVQVSLTRASALAANLVVTQFPRGMIETAGGTAADSYTLLNSGGTAADVTLTQNGSFFTQSPTSFTLAPGDSRSINITAMTATGGVV